MSRGGSAGDGEGAEYFRTKATPVPVEVILSGSPTRFRAVEEFRRRWAAQAARATIPGEWTIHEVVDHLVETYGPGLDWSSRVPAREVLRPSPPCARFRTTRRRRS